LEPIKEGENNAYYLIRTGRLLNLQEPSFFALENRRNNTHTHTYSPLQCNNKYHYK